MHEKRCTAGIVLAAGSSTRFGTGNKLLATVEGTPLVRRTVRAYVEAGLYPVLVVTGYQETEIRHSLSGMAIQFVHNERFREGQSTSLHSALDSLPLSCQAAVIGVGDQPYLTPAVVRELVATFNLVAAPLVVPRYAGNRGNPVVFDRSLFAELRAVSGDVGGRPVLKRHEHEVHWIDFTDAQFGADVDIPEDIEHLLP